MTTDRYNLYNVAMLSQTPAHGYRLHHSNIYADSPDKAQACLRQGWGLAEAQVLQASTIELEHGVYPQLARPVTPIRSESETYV